MLLSANKDMLSQYASALVISLFLNFYISIVQWTKVNTPLVDQRLQSLQGYCEPIYFSRTPLYHLDVNPVCTRIIFIHYAHCAVSSVYSSAPSSTLVTGDFLQKHRLAISLFLFQQLAKTFWPVLEFHNAHSRAFLKDFMFAVACSLMNKVHSISSRVEFNFLGKSQTQTSLMLLITLLWKSDEAVRASLLRQ